MSSESVVTMPAGSRTRLLLRPVLGLTAAGLILGFAVALVLLAVGELARDDLHGWILLLVPAAVLGVLGAMQAAWWNHRLGSVSYVADRNGLRVLRGAGVLHTWAWSDIHWLELEGEISWRGFLVYREGLDEFPRLVIHTAQGVIKPPGVLIWGSDDPKRLRRELLFLYRDYSH